MNEQTSWNSENGPVTEIKNEIRRLGNIHGIYPFLLKIATFY